MLAASVAASTTLVARYVALRPMVIFAFSPRGGVKKLRILSHRESFPHVSFANFVLDFLVGIYCFKAHRPGRKQLLLSRGLSYLLLNKLFDGNLFGRILLTSCSFVIYALAILLLVHNNFIISRNKLICIGGFFYNVSNIGARNKDRQRGFAPHRLHRQQTGKRANSGKSHCPTWLANVAFSFAIPGKRGSQASCFPSRFPPNAARRCPAPSSQFPKLEGFVNETSVVLHKSNFRFTCY